MHTTRDKKAFLKRLRIIRGQLNAVESALEDNRDSRSVLQLIAIVRGATDAVMAQMLEEQLRFHVLLPSSQPPEQRPEIERLIEVVRRYVK